MIAAILAVAMATTFSLHGGATLVDDDGPAVRIRVGGYHTNDSVQSVGTLAFADLLVAHAGRPLQVCVRSRATKPGELTIWIPRAGPVPLEIPYDAEPRYRTRCAPFVVVASPTTWPGYVQVASDGVLGRYDFIRNVTIREGL